MGITIGILYGLYLFVVNCYIDKKKTGDSDWVHNLIASIKWGFIVYFIILVLGWIF